MPWALYSPENYPKQTEDGMADYRQAYGVQIILHAHSWTELDELGYKIEYYGNWIEAAGDAKEVFVSSEQIASRIAGDFKMRGIRAAKLEGDKCYIRNMQGKLEETAKEVIENESKQQNLRFRKQMVDRFEVQFRIASLGQPGGRLVPTAYEEECYKMIGSKPPELVQRIPEAPKQQTIIAQPDPELIALLVKQELDRLTTPRSADRG